MIYVNARFLTQNLTGVQRYGIEISLELKKIYNENIQFLCPSNIIHEEIAKRLDVQIIGKHLGHIWEQWDLYVYLKKQSADSILLCLGNTAPILYKRKIVTIHDITFIRYPKTFKKSFLLLYRFIIPLIIKTSRHIFTVSEFSKKELSSYYNLDKLQCSVAYNAVNNFFQQESNEVKESYYLTVSSVKENKNTLLPLKAFKKLYEKNFKYHLYVIGDLSSKSFNDYDIEQYKHLPNIHFLGRVTDEGLRLYYQKARGFIFPSLYEGFGIPPLEAQACGCPVISSSYSCMPEVLKDSVIYFDPLSDDDLIEKLKYLNDNPKEVENLVKKGYVNVERFSWHASALEYKKQLDKL